MRCAKEILNGYRYGFGGQEKDDEISGAGNSYTAMFWQYDSRLGRRWNLDPKPNPSISSYATFSNNPIFYSDPLGDTVRVAGTKKEMRQFKRLLQKTTGNKYSYNEQGDLFSKGNSSNISTDEKKSGELSMLVGQGIASTDVIDVNLTSGSSSISFDKYSTGKLDLQDFKNAPREFQAAMLGHVFSERMATPGGYGSSANRTNANWLITHPGAMVVESSILTSMRGVPYALRSVGASQPNMSQVPNASGVLVTKVTSWSEIWKYGMLNYRMTLGNKRTPLNNGTGLFKSKPAVGKVFGVKRL